MFTVVTIYITDPAKRPAVVHAYDLFETRREAVNAAGRMKRALIRRWGGFGPEPRVTFHAVEVIEGLET